jgi:CHAT domain
VRILEQGSVQGIREALEQARYHVLYLSCHARPGELILEDPDGKEDPVSAETLWEKALPGGRGVPLIVLAGCATGRHGPAGQASGALPSVARGLVSRGVPAVVAMQGAVSDRYATALGGALLEALATGRPPHPWPPWPRPAGDWSASAAPLPRPSARRPSGPRPPSTPPARCCPSTIPRRPSSSCPRCPSRGSMPAWWCAGWGISSVGGASSASPSRPCGMPKARGGWCTAWAGWARAPSPPRSCTGWPRTAGCWPRWPARWTWTRCSASWAWPSSTTASPPSGPRTTLRQVAGLLREPKVPWSDRLELLHAQLPRERRLALLLDNFEDNLDPAHAPPEAFGAFLAHWLARPGRTRLLITSRYPLRLPQGLETRLAPLHLGPLSPAEARKLILRLEALNALAPAARQRAYEQVGGHPRALEYLDALLRGGQAHFDDVTRRLSAALAARGIADPSRWCAAAGGDLDRALAETVTLATDDVLLEGLLARLADSCSVPPSTGCRWTRRVSSSRWAKRCRPLPWSHRPRRTPRPCSRPRLRPSLPADPSTPTVSRSARRACRRPCRPCRPCRRALDPPSSRPKAWPRP